MNESQKIELTLSAAPKEEREESKLRDVANRTLEQGSLQKIQIDDSQLTEEEKKAVEEFSKQIDITASEQVLTYGVGAQQKIAEFSDNALNNVTTKDLGSVGEMMANLVGELKGFSADEEDNKGFFGFFKKQANKLQMLKARYDKAEVNVDKIVKALEGHQITLLKDIALLDELYDRNLLHFKELTMYILAGQKRLEEVRRTDLKALQEKAAQTGKPEDAQAVNDLNNAIIRFEKKIHDLELTRVVSLQMAPQIRLVQNNDTLMTEKIQSTLVNTIPLWKSQMLIAVGLSHSEQAMKAQRETAEFTNKLLKENADRLKTATINTAQE
ncbi:MAG: toxic anion resistance protein, partial [Bacillota bacterium]|nr:toxic anion resistance protein [Bacillota bacterium]